MRYSVFASIGEGNVGDELVFAGVIEELKEVDPDAKINAFSHSPAETKQIHPEVDVERIIPTGVRTFFKWILTPQFWRGLKIILKSDYVVIGGGGLFYDREMDRGVNPILVWFLRCLFFKFLGCKIIIYGVGIGPIEGRSSHFLLREICRMASLVIVRDQPSRRLLRELRLEVDVDIKLGEDPAWSAYKNWLLTSRAKPQSISKKKRKGPIIAVALRAWYPSGSKTERVFLRRVATFLDKLSDNEGISIKLLPFSVKAPDDRPILSKLKELTKVRDTEFIADYLSPQGMISQLRECDAVVAMRLHSILLALRLGKPLIPISYESKTEALLARVKLNDLIVSVSSMTTSALMASWQLAKHKASFVREGQGTNVQLLREFLQHKEDARK